MIKMLIQFSTYSEHGYETSKRFDIITFENRNDITMENITLELMKNEDNFNKNKKITKKEINIYNIQVI